MRRGQSGSTNRAGAQYAPIAAKSVMHAVSRAHTGAVDGVFARSKEALQRLQVGRKNRGLRRFPLFTPPMHERCLRCAREPGGRRLVPRKGGGRMGPPTASRSAHCAGRCHDRPSRTIGIPPQFFWPNAIPVHSQCNPAHGSPDVRLRAPPVCFIVGGLVDLPLHRRRCPCQRFSFAPAPPSSSPSAR